ncbi:MAG: cytochrome c [Euryarchaeota archaeon]|nr:cytochrome c [Euryarchaeota archaeon]
MARRLLLLLVVVAAVVIAGCSHHTPPPLASPPLAQPLGQTTPRAETPPAATPAAARGDAARGKDIFEKVASPACTSCHATGDSRIVGPGLKGVGSKGDAYIRESIVSPDAVVVSGFPPGVMPKTFKDQLSPEQLDDLVAYLKSL